MNEAGEPGRFSRSELLLGAASVERLKRCHVAVFGLGGVGSYAVEALARAGVGTLTLVDYDRICKTNINRQLYALDSTVDRLKVEVAAERCRDINPQITVFAVSQRYTPDNGAELLKEPFDFVLDCIDTISAKLDLITTCKQQQLAVISSMGAANKRDPGQVVVDDLFRSRSCRLARIMRKELRKRGIEQDLPAVFSTEQGSSACEPIPAVVRRKGVAIERPPMGSISTIPPLFGLMMAGFVINTLTEVAP